MKPQPTQPAASQRLLSLDALRGFDMLFIMGFAGLVTALCKLCPGEFSDWMTAQMGHADWNGFFHHDTIFPLFLFIAGMSGVGVIVTSSPMLFAAIKLLGASFLIWLSLKLLCLKTEDSL